MFEQASHSVLRLALLLSSEGTTAPDQSTFQPTSRSPGSSTRLWLLCPVSRTEHHHRTLCSAVQQISVRKRPTYTHLPTPRPNDNDHAPPH
ncbi:hypothetical protein BKA63DRAFT_524944 [Paraphoma chrysanthemicola]|nr:hypothetical protein BKA63DRAFT_524944 [Paraphoma chrysanthemicola]